MGDLTVFRWVLDVKHLWPSSPETDKTREATARWAEGEDASHALSLLTPEERAKVLRFYRPSDARLSLASCLLKHLAIVETCNIAWSEVTIGEDSNRKPCYKPADPNGRACQFNVSHHGTLVTLVGCAGDAVKVGVDVMKMDFERDYPKVLRDGFEAWANIYEMVFSEREIRDIAGYVPPAQLDSKEDIRAKLRNFSVHWSLKEAYLKMTGEALLSSGLKDLEFRNVMVPLARSQLTSNVQRGDEWGQTCTDVEIWFHGQRVTDVKLDYQAFQEEYIIATASSNTEVTFSAFKELNVLNDIYSKAQ